MPGVYFNPTNRRTFLSYSAKALGVLAMTRGLRSGASADSAQSPVHLALLSDTHIPADPKDEYRKFFPSENLKACVPDVMKAQPEGVVISGDLARLSGELADYEALKSQLTALAEQCPVYMGLGNHDHRENFAKIFNTVPGDRQTVSDRHVVVVEKPGIRFIVLDSLLYVNKVPGLLGKAQREWLDKHLASSDPRPTVLFVHHTLGDGDGELLDSEAFIRVAQAYKKVKAIFYGHSHQYVYARERGLHLVNLPAVGYNFADKEPVGWVDARFTTEGAELTLRALAGNREKDGQTVTLEWRS